MGAAALQRQENCEEPNYQRTRMQKDVVIQELKKRGCRITKQRRMLLEVILENECSCCKEIYYNASRLDPGIGSAYGVPYGKPFWKKLVRSAEEICIKS